MVNKSWEGGGRVRPRIGWEEHVWKSARKKVGDLAGGD